MTTIAEKSWFGESRVLFGGGKGVGFTAIFTARKRSLGQGNIFRRLCQEFCPQGAWFRVCVCGCRVGRHAWLPGGMCGCRGCVWLQWGVHGCLGWGCVGYDEIRSMSGRYTSYWNAFLLSIKWNSIRQGVLTQGIVAKSLPGALFVCLKLQFVQLFPVRSLFNLQEK